MAVRLLVTPDAEQSPKSRHERRPSGSAWSGARERRLAGRDAGDLDPVGRAGDVVQAHLVAEADGVRVAAVLAADAELDVRLRPAGTLRPHPHHLPHPPAPPRPA